MDLLSPRTLKRLATGSDPVYMSGEPASEDELREAWALVGPQILADHIARQPCSRPWGWWRFQAPERKRCISHAIHPFDDPERQARIEAIASEPGAYPGYKQDAYELYYGEPNCWLAGDFHHTYESNLNFLTRLHLLLPGECEALVAMPDDPQEMRTTPLDKL